MKRRREGLFDGRRVLLVGRGMPSVQQKIICKRLIENGANVIELNEWKHQWDFTDIVSVLQWDKLKDALNEKGIVIPIVNSSVESPRYHTLDWVTESLTQRRRMDDNLFIIQPIDSQQTVDKQIHSADTADSVESDKEDEKPPIIIDRSKDDGHDEKQNDDVGDDAEYDDDIPSPPSDSSCSVSPSSSSSCLSIPSFPSLSDSNNPDSSVPSSSSSAAAAATTATTTTPVSSLSSSESKPKRLNGAILDALEQLAESTRLNKDHWREHAYTRAINVIRYYPREIKSGSELASIRGVGIKTQQKIDEILSTGKLAKLEALRQNEHEQILLSFMRIHGIGPDMANKWYARGYRSYADLRAHQDELTSTQRVALKYVEEFQQKIPRAQIALVEDVFRDVLQREICGGSPSPMYECIICGSYRRQRPVCGDIDVLVTQAPGNTSAEFAPDMLPRLVAALKKRGLITDDLSDSADSHKKYFGVCCIPNQGIHRRLDISFFPRASFAYALLHFTGSGEFNRALRLHARKTGFSLGETGLFPAHKRGSVMIKDGPSLPAATEEDIFDLLHVKYVPPEKRDTTVLEILTPQ